MRTNESTLMESLEGKEPSPELVELTADIVSAYVTKNVVVADQMPKLIEQTFDALKGIKIKEAQPHQAELEPAVSVKKSVTPDEIICLECGKKFKSLKRHLRTDHDLTPDEYREKWKLAHDYPMVAPTYAAARSRLAKKMGLGRKDK